MHCLYGGYNLHRFSDALGLVKIFNFVRNIALIDLIIVLLSTTSRTWSKIWRHTGQDVIFAGSNTGTGRYRRFYPQWQATVPQGC